MVVHGRNWLSLSEVDLHVFIEVGFLRKCLTTTREAANERTFTSVDAQVVEEVVPLAEEHGATHVVALQDLHLAARPRVFELEDPEVAGTWNRFLHFEVCKVKLMAGNNFHHRSLRNFLSYFLVLNVLSPHYLECARRVFILFLTVLLKCAVTVVTFARGCGGKGFYWLLIKDKFGSVQQV